MKRGSEKFEKRKRTKKRRGRNGERVMRIIQ
jgi:hypothetical protein